MLARLLPWLHGQVSRRRRQARISSATTWREQGLPGALVLTTSANAVVAKRGSVAYDCSKAAANHLARELTVELAPICGSSLPGGVHGRAGVSGGDLGAESGRVMAGRFDGRRVRLEELPRFPNGPVEAAGSLRWDVRRLEAEVRAGLMAAAARVGPAVASVGVDAWGVDYVLLSQTGEPLGQPFHYRDCRTDGAMDRLEGATGVPVAEPTHRRRHRPPGRRGPGGGDRARERAGAGPLGGGTGLGG